MKVENKVKKIIREEFDARVAMAVATYVIGKGTENLTEITEEMIEEVKGNAFMTDMFVQALVRAGVRISKECDVIDDFLPYIVTELYVPKAKTHDVAMYKEYFDSYSDYYSWEELLKELDMDYDEDVDDVVGVELSVVVTDKYYKDK